MRSCHSTGGPAPEMRDDTRACRVCNCTHATPCETAYGPCGWSEADLCTACVGRPAEIYDALDALTIAVGKLTPAEFTAGSIKRDLSRALREARRVLEA